LKRDKCKEIEIKNKKKENERWKISYLFL
jgi:hypothetical protein